MKTQEVASLKTRTLIITAVLTVVLLGAWEMYARSKQYQASPNDDEHLWAYHRAKLDHLKNDDVVIIGSSRVMFDFQLNEWEATHGKRPVMLAAAGSSTLPVLRDVVDNSSFAGTLIVGVTPALYFVPQMMGVVPYDRIQKWVDHYHKRTYADRFNHFLSVNGPQKIFSFLTSSNEIFYNELDLRTLIEQVPVKQRIPTLPPFPLLYYINEDRNVNLMPQVTQDTAYAKMVTNFWTVVFQPPPGPTPPQEVIEQNKNDIIAQSTALLNKFKARGGKVIMVCCPSQNKVRDIEAMYYPREHYWDQLVKSIGSPSYHFEDYPFMNKYILPEWSHLSTPDAKKFTVDFVNQLKRDKIL